MTLQLYYMTLSAPCRTVTLLARTLDLKLEIKNVDLLAGEQYSEEYIKMNPMHTVPFLVDGDFHLAESRAIIMYLCEVYGSETGLFPEDPKRRATVAQRLFFDNGVLWARFAQCYLHPVVWKKQGIDESLVDKVEDAFTTLNSYLEEARWVAGDHITIADYAVLITVATAEAVDYDLSKYPNVKEWLPRCKEAVVDYEEINGEGLQAFAEFYKEQLSKLDN